MKFGFVIPGGDANTVIRLASEAERAGWDAVFYYDAIWIKGLPEVHSAWAIIAAIAVITRKIRIGSFLTAIARRNPWEVAREAVTVDHLSKGRLTIPVGLGTLDDGGYSNVGLPTDRRTRAERLDEGLQIIDQLWSGRPLGFKGKHYAFETMDFKPRPLQRPRIPIWVVGAWPREKSMRRAIQWDGVIASKMSGKGTFEKVTPDDIALIKRYAREKRKKSSHFDIIIDRQISESDWKKPKDAIQPYADAGATWWADSIWSYTSMAQVLRRIKRGPPAI